LPLSDNNEVKYGGLGEYRPKELDRLSVTYIDGKRKVTCFCGKEVLQSIVPHLKKDHIDLWDRWKKIFVVLVDLGYSWKQIMRLFSTGDGRLLFSWTVIEKTIREEVEAGEIQYSPKPISGIKRWEPTNFIREKTTVWDFPQRGNWAVHSGRYRGNWPPQIPRNLIAKYTNEEDLIIDAFAGGGTTLIEAWLMSRKSVGLDISKLAIQTMNHSLEQMERSAKITKGVQLDLDYRPIVIGANALELGKIIKDHSIDTRRLRLICAHPPYLNSIRYTTNNENDLALISDVNTFYDRIQTFAREVWSLLQKDGICAILIGDVRRNRKIIPLGLKTLNIFLEEGFEVEDIIIKTQYRDKLSEFWVGHKSGILLIAHEYLLVLKKG
jgi:16S rRNA G966 N2-methylase RsmD